MACRRPGDKPLSEPIMVRLTTHICVTRPQWVNWSNLAAVNGLWCYGGNVHVIKHHVSWSYLVKIMDLWHQDQNIIWSNVDISSLTPPGTCFNDIVSKTENVSLTKCIRKCLQKGSLSVYYWWNYMPKLHLANEPLIVKNREHMLSHDLHLHHLLRPFITWGNTSFEVPALHQMLEIELNDDTILQDTSEYCRRLYAYEYTMPPTPPHPLPKTHTHTSPSMFHVPTHDAFRK